MPTIYITGHSEKTIEVEAGTSLSLMEVIRNNGFGELLSICGGCCSCATCHVYIDSDHFDQLGEISDEESDLLEAAPHRETNSRLSCQIAVTEELDGLRVTIPAMD